MKLVAVALLGLVAGMLINSSPTQAGKDEHLALLCQRFKDAGGVSWKETWQERAKSESKYVSGTQKMVADPLSVAMGVMEDTFCK